MARFLAFAVGCVLVIATVVAINARVDPFAWSYSNGMLDAALQHSPPCLISNEAVQPRNELDFKLALVRLRRAKTVVLGSSRVQAMRALPGEHNFVNVGLPSTSAVSLVPILKALRKVNAGPLRIYIGVDPFWFNEPAYTGSTFHTSLHDWATYYLSREALFDSFKEVTRHPGTLVTRWRVRSGPEGCVVDRAAKLRSIDKTNAFRVTDGAIVYPWDLGAPVANPIAANERVDPFTQFPFLDHWRSFSAAETRDLSRALSLAQSYGWDVVGYAPPYSHSYAAILETDPRTKPFWNTFRRVMPAIFHRHHSSFLDLGDAGTIPCAETEFEFDPSHPDSTCDRRIRVKLDAVKN